MEKLREEHETYQEEQAVAVAIAAPVLAAGHRDLASASIAQEVSYLKKTLLASLPAVAMLLAFYPPFGGARGSWATHDLHLQAATGLLAVAALQKLIQLLHVEVGLLEQDVFRLDQGWPGLRLLAHKRTGKRMMTLQTNHSRR